MTSKIKRKKTNNGGEKFSLKRNLIISAAVAVALYAVFISVAAVIMTKTNINANILPYIYIAVCIISSFISGLIACKGVKHKKIIVTLISSLIIMVIVFIPILITDNKDLSLKTLILIPSVLIPSLLSAVISR